MERIKRRQLKKKGVKRLYKRKKLLLNVKNYKRRRRSLNYSIS
jgi:hypothetical protein